MRFGWPADLNQEYPYRAKDDISSQAHCMLAGLFAVDWEKS